MKIQINYDLLNKVTESKKGFSLNQISKYVSKCTLGSLVVDASLSLIFLEPPEKFLFDSIFYLIFHTILGTTVHISLSELCKRKSDRDLLLLALKLYQLDIITDLNLIKKSYAYHTDYKMINNNNKDIPILKQNKYIILPVYENGEESEVSILQEHIIGSKKYVLSIGEPEKQLKLVHNTI